MEDFARLFGGLLTFTYHCFDRMRHPGTPATVC